MDLLTLSTETKNITDVKNNIGLIFYDYESRFKTRSEQ